MRVFLSHASRDDEKVIALAAALRERGIDVWLDRWELISGDDFVARINRALLDADAGLIVFSAAAAKSRWVSAEISYLIWASVEQGKLLIPVVVDPDAPIPPLVQPLLRRGIEEVGAIADALLGRRAVKPRLGSAAEGRTWRAVISLERAGGEGLQLEVRLGGEVFASERLATLPAAVLRGQEIFRGGFEVGVRRDRLAAEREAREADLSKLGHALRKLCLPAGAAEALAELVDGSPAGTTIEVVFESGDAHLLGLPFEALRLADDRLLVLDPKVVMLRRPAGFEPAPAQRMAGPLKILVAVGAPDEGKTQNVVLDQERELQRMLDAVEGARRLENVEVRILEVGSPEQIGEALERDAYHVLHLSCHGGPGLLELEDEEGGALPVTAAELLAPILAQGRPLPMVFLNSCHGAARAGETSSLAEDLLRAGIPSVLAMLTSVSDHYATQLAGLFYQHLAKRDSPRPSRALAAARRELEMARRKALATGTAVPERSQPEVATATLFVAGEEIPLLDPSLDREALKSRPVYEVSGPVPQLRIDELIGRRKELRQTLKNLREKERQFVGVVLSGIGGVGKSALAGRVMQRLEEEGWMVVAHHGRLGFAAITALIGQGLLLSGQKKNVQLAQILGNNQVDEMQRFELAARTLAQEQILLVLDDFEQNLTADGSQFLDKDVPALLAALLQNARSSRVLITCRYPLPGFAAELQEVPIGPLSDAESRKLLLRLGALRERPPEEIEKVLRLIGGHPRMLELLDALLRGGQGRLALVTKKLQELLEKANIPSGEIPASLDAALKQALTLGSRDVLLEELLASAREEGSAEALLQLAVSNLPVSAAGLARMLTEDPLKAETIDVKAAEKAIAQLARLSLVFRRPSGEAWVHRWTAEGLAILSEEEKNRQRHWRAGRYRVWRVQNETDDLGDAIEATRNFLAGHHWEDAKEVAIHCIEALRQFQQLTSIAALASEVLETLPAESSDYAFIADQEASAHFALGWTSRAMGRYQTLLALFQERVAAEPQRADHQSSLSAICQRVGDLYRALGEGENALNAFLKALEIAERLAAAQPEQADVQRDLSISYDKIGDIYCDFREGDKARNVFMKALNIREQLVSSNPKRADYHRDLSVSYEKMGDLFIARGEGENAFHAFLKSLEIREHLAAAEPQRPDYQRDLSVALDRIGDLYSVMRESENARKHFLKALEIRKRLATVEPQRADYRVDLAISYERFASVDLSMGNLPEAHQAFSQALAIYERLIAAEPLRADYQIQIWVPLTQLGMLEGRAGKAKIERALAFLERLHAEGRLPPSQMGRIEKARKMLNDVG